MLRSPRRHLPRPHSAFAGLLTTDEAQGYLPHVGASDSLVYVALYGYGWDRGPQGPTKRHRRREPVAIVTWDPHAREVRSVTGFSYPFCVEYHALVMVIERPQDLEDLVDRLHPFVDPRDKRVYLA